MASGVISISTNQHSDWILTGGYDSQVRLWQVGRQTQVMLNISRNVHKTPVSAVKFIKNVQMAASCSVDGQLVLWDMIESKEKKALTVLTSIQIPVQQLKKIEKDMGVISLEYNQVSNELILLGTDRKLKFLSVAS